MPLRRAIQARSHVPSPLSVILRRRHDVPDGSRWRTWRNTKVDGVKPLFVVFETAATTFTVSPKWKCGTRFVTSYSALGSATSSSKVSFRYTLTSLTATVWRPRSTTVQSWGDNLTTRHPRPPPRPRTSPAAWAIRPPTGSPPGLNTPPALV